MLRPTGEGGETTKRRRKPEPKSEPKRRRTKPSRTSQPREREPRKRLSPRMIANYQPPSTDYPITILEALSQFQPDPMGPLTGDFSLTPRTSPNVFDYRGLEPDWWRMVAEGLPIPPERGEM